MASAPGNIFFSGEHAVVYGKPAIVASVGKRTHVSITTRSDDMVLVNSKELGIAEMRVNGEAKRGPEQLMVILEFLDSLVMKAGLVHGFDVRIESEIPVASGMSSSTAVLSAILHEFNRFAGLGLEKREYFDIIHPFQEKIHGGKASGSEIYSSVFGGFHWLERRDKLVGEGIEGPSIPVVIGDTRVKAPTKLTVGYHVPSLIDRYPERVDSAWDEIERITKDMRRAIEHGDLEGIGELVNANQSVLSDLKLSHPKIDDLIDEALKAGALGAKMSGGGWGGIMFAVCRPEDRDKVAKAMQRTRANIIVTDLGVDGVN